MDEQFPQAEGRRDDWPDVAPTIRAAIEDRLGSRVLEAHTQRGGFSPGLAARCDLANGDRVFLKAADPAVNADTPGFHLREAHVASQLPPDVPAPRLRWHLAIDGWAVLCFDCVDGRQPHVPWRDDELARVVAAIDDMAVALTPAPIEAPRVVDHLDSSFRRFERMIGEQALGRDMSMFDPWVIDRLDDLASLASSWADGAKGTTLLHSDLRADNILLTDDEVLFVDWPHVCVGAPWFDLLGLLPSVAMQGGRDPEAVFLSTELGRTADPQAVTATLAGLASYFVHQGHEPPPPGIPTVRALQRGQGAAAIAWLRQRLGD